MHGFTPVHGAVLANSVEEITLLLKHGARLDLPDRKFGLTPLELARKLQREGKAETDRSAVISLLSSSGIRPE